MRNIALTRSSSKETQMSTFKIGQTYASRLHTDHDCFFKIVVLSRTATSVRVRGPLGDKIETLPIRVCDGIEHVRPLAGFALSPVISAAGASLCLPI